MTGPGMDLEHALRERFKLSSFRPWQREAVEAVLPEGSRVLVVAPTGGGKSLTYQFPATLLPGVTLVLSPLVALMEDQVRSLENRGIAATFLASTLDAETRSARESGLRRGRYKIVYLAPERLAHDGYVENLARLRIALVAIDEAHCISQWGHDFRPDYLRIGAVLERLRPPRVLACTATATPEVRREIRERLGFHEENTTEVLRGFARPNLHLAARNVDGPTEARRFLEGTLSKTLGSSVRPNGGSIVYVATRKQTEEISSHLQEKGWNAAAYHAGMDGSERTRVAEKFAKKHTDVVVATNAFGMGIDRADIRLVVHAQPPSSIEAYYQEVGRAGRDGGEAFGLLLCSGQDIALRRRMVDLGSDGKPADPRLAARNWRHFCDLLRYVDAGTCRHDFVLRYFGDEHEVLGGCGHCDVCAELDGNEPEEAQQEEIAKMVRIGLSAVARAKGRAGMQAITEMLRGAHNQRTERLGFTRLTTFGLLKDRHAEWVLALLRGLMAAGWIDLVGEEYPVPVITNAGWDVMRSDGAVRFRLPRTPAKKLSGKKTAVKGLPPLPPEAQRVFERLRTARNAIAKTAGVPAYVVAMDRSLHELSLARPKKLYELASIYGLGPARIEAYGKALLEALR